MKIKNSLLIAAGSCLLFMAACQSPRDQLVKKWQVTSFHNPIQDSMRAVHEKSIDTMSYVDTNMAAFLGTSDLDSIKSILKKRLTEEEKIAADAARQTALSFRKDSTLVISSGVNVDTFNWVLSEDDKKITITPQGSPLPTQTQVFEIATLSKDKLQLTMNNGQSTIQINLRPFTKEDSIAAAKLLQQQLEEQMARKRQIQQMQQQMQQQQLDQTPAEASAQ